jgi:16S rRNA U516 pseudouridylate synthase RsuA-like enzyme
MTSKASVTLDRALSRIGLLSRSAAGEAIRGGKVKVDGRVVRDPETWVDPKRQVIHLDGMRAKPVRRIYLLLYKFKGVITSHGDPGRRKTVYDCLARLPVKGEEPTRTRSVTKSPATAEQKKQWVFPVGRLDKDTSGVLLMTNDTEFGDFMTSPESRVPKTYLVKATGLMSDAVIGQLQDGVVMKRGDSAARSACAGWRIVVSTRGWRLS